MSVAAATIPSPPSHKLATGVRNPTGAWSQAAQKKLEQANAEIMASTHLRGESVKANQTLMKQVVTQQKFVNDRLKKRIKECKAYHAKLQSAHKVLSAEQVQLQDARFKLSELKRKFDRQGNLSSQRALLRNERPAQEKIADIASKAISTHTEGVKASQDHLQTDVDSAAQLLEKIQRTLTTLQKDIEHKAHAIHVDTECLHFDLDTHGNQVNHGTASSADGTGSTTPGSHHHAPPVHMLPSASEGPYAIQKSKTDPDYWKQVSAVNLEGARGLSIEAKDLRTNMMVHAQKAITKNTSLNSDVMESLTKRKTQTRQFLNLMQTQIQKIDLELGVLEEQNEQVIIAMCDKERPLEIVKKRLEARQNRPGREAVRDEVEIELEKEFSRLVAAVEALQKKQVKIHTESERLIKQRGTVSDDHDCKLSALHLEHTCMEIDTKTEYQLNSGRGTPRSSRGGTPRVYTPRGGTPRGGTPRGATPRGDAGFLPTISTPRR